MSVHPAALVDPGARLGEGVEVGPYAIIGEGVVVADRCRIAAHACLAGPLELGEASVVDFSAVLGSDPQVKGKAGPFGATRIGARNVFREFSQVNRSMESDGATVIGDDGYFMATSHVAHDCALGHHVVVCNCALLAGHVEVQDRAFVSGGVVVHQFVRIGELAMIGGNAAIHVDMPPFCMAVGDRPRTLEGLNLVGLRRAGYAPEARRALKAAFRQLFRSDLPLRERLAAVDRSVPEVERLVAFLERSERGVIGFGSRG
ncbi:MAG: acyl-ACP--UDP-N-acetylglucosamine O-acyltransferase [Planctomycetota bacterium]|jgi:UDP-N-acetylglucosamine acyltransferase